MPFADGWVPRQFFQDSERKHKGECADKVPGSLHFLGACDLSLIQSADPLRVVRHVRAVQADDSAVSTRPKITKKERRDISCEVCVVFDNHYCVGLILVVRQVSCRLNPVLEVSELA
jgi:hypothetical protein